MGAQLESKDWHKRANMVVELSWGSLTKEVRGVVLHMDAKGKGSISKKK